MCRLIKFDLKVNRYITTCSHTYCKKCYLNINLPSCSEWGAISSTLLVFSSIIHVCCGEPVVCAVMCVTSVLCVVPILRHFVIWWSKCFLTAFWILLAADNSSSVGSLQNKSGICEHVELNVNFSVTVVCVYVCMCVCVQFVRVEPPCALWCNK